ncbi:hypothetical protein D9M71_234280 [compost metagenome]
MGEGVDALLAAIAALLEATTRRLHEAATVLVDHDAPRIQAGGHAVHASDIAAPDTGAEAELAIVGDAQGIGFVLEGDDAKDGAEDFFPGQGHVVVHAGVDGRFDVPAVAQVLTAGHLAADGGLQAFALGYLEVALDLLELRPGGDGAGGGVELRTDAQDGNLCQQLVDEAVVDVLLHQQAGAGTAPLAAVPGKGAGGAPGSGVEVGVVEDDIGRLAAQLQGQRQDAFGGDAAQFLAGGDAASEGNLAHQRIARHRRADDAALADDHVEHAGRQAGFFHGDAGQLHQ